MISRAKSTTCRTIKASMYDTEVCVVVCHLGIAWRMRGRPEVRYGFLFTCDREKISSLL